MAVEDGERGGDVRGGGDECDEFVYTGEDGDVLGVVVRDASEANARRARSVDVVLVAITDQGARGE